MISLAITFRTKLFFSRGILVYHLGGMRAGLLLLLLSLLIAIVENACVCPGYDLLLWKYGVLRMGLVQLDP